MIHILTIAALLAAQPAGDKCLTEQQAGDLFATVIPGLIEGAARQCQATLPADSFLVRESGAVVQRLRAERPSPERMASVFDVLGEEKALRGVDPALMGQVMDQAISAKLLDGFQPDESCRPINALVEALAPLPARNIAQATVAIIGLSSGKKGDSPFRLCPVAP